MSHADKSQRCHRVVTQMSHRSHTEVSQKVTQMSHTVVITWITEKQKSYMSYRQVSKKPHRWSQTRVTKESQVSQKCNKGATKMSHRDGHRSMICQVWQWSVKCEVVDKSQVCHMSVTEETMGTGKECTGLDKDSREHIGTGGVNKESTGILGMH